jgi:hypothetical protein
VICKREGLVGSQERERLAVEADKGTRLRMRRQDVIAKEAELDELIQSHRSRLESFLKSRGRGYPYLCSYFSKLMGYARCVHFQSEEVQLSG